MKLSYAQQYIPYEIGDFIMINGNEKDIFKIEEMKMTQYVRMQLSFVEIQISFDGRILEQWITPNIIAKRIK